MNKVYLIGNLSKDPEARTTANGISNCTFSIAVSRGFKKEDGTTDVDFFNITAWRNQAENCVKYLKKGSKVAIVGSLQNRSYEDKDKVKRYITDIIASDIEFLSPIGKDRPTTDQQQTNNKPTTEKPSIESCDDDLPF